MKRVIFASIAAACAAASQAQFVGPTPYLQASDSPWAAVPFSWFQRDTFETGAQSVTGVTITGGAVLNPSSITDSVDADDGAVDGHGSAGHSWFNSGGSSGITFTFNSTVLGALPTHVGIVWTDGVGAATFEAWDQNGVSLGTLTGSHADGVFTGTTAEDRFYGMVHAGGISKVKIKGASGGLEVDHLQFGYAVPEPATLFGLSGALLLLRRRKQTS